MISRAGARTAAHLAAVVLALAAAIALPGKPARAEACAGVTAVVDFGALGGGIQQRCVPDGAGRPAWDVFEEAGFPLTPVQQFPDAVCRVSGKPAADACVRMPPANAYWGLFWNKSTGWSYASQGARSLTVPAGSSVGLAWQNSSAQRAPGAPASSSVGSPTPTRSSTPKQRTTTKPRPLATSAAPTARSTTSATAGSSSSAPVGTPHEPSAQSTAAVPTPSSGPSSPSAAGPFDSQRTQGSDQSRDGLPWWLPVGSIAVLAGAGGIVWRVRRTRP